MKHSKAPWSNQMNRRVLDADGLAVCEINQFPILCENNATLITSAPELLKALKNIVNELGEKETGENSKEYMIDNICRKAIAKAEGK